MTRYYQADDYDAGIASIHIGSGGGHAMTRECPCRPTRVHTTDYGVDVYYHFGKKRDPANWRHEFRGIVEAVMLEPGQWTLGEDEGAE